MYLVLVSEGEKKKRLLDHIFIDNMLGALNALTLQLQSLDHLKIKKI